MQVMILEPCVGCSFFTRINENDADRGKQHFFHNKKGFEANVELTRLRKNNAVKECGSFSVVGVMKYRHQMRFLLLPLAI